MFPIPEDQQQVGGIQDYIFLKNLQLSAVVGKDAWDRDMKPQPVILSLRLQMGIEAAARTDDVSLTVNYGQVCKNIISYVEQQQVFKDLLDFVSKIRVLTMATGCAAVFVRAILPKASLRAEGGLGLESASFNDERATNASFADRFLVNDLKIPCIIGVNTHERYAKQIVVVNLELTEDDSRDGLKDPIPSDIHEHWSSLLREVILTIEDSSYETLEALAMKVLQIAFTRYAVGWMRVSIEKPSALAFVEGAGVQITRTYAEYLRK